MEDYLDYVFPREGARQFEPLSNNGCSAPVTPDRYLVSPASVLRSPLLLYEFDETLPACRAEVVDLRRRFADKPLILVSPSFGVDTVLWAACERITDLVSLPAEQGYLRWLIQCVEKSLHTTGISSGPSGRKDLFPLWLAMPRAGLARRSASVRQSLDHIHQHFNRKIRTQDLATLSNMSLSTFQRAFKNALDLTCSDYVKTLRCHVAKQLLRHTHLQIGEIAYVTGFCDASHFGRHFRSLVQEAPGEFRSRITKPAHRVA